MNTPDPRLDAALQRAREALDASLEGLDGATAARLTRARHTALAHLPSRRSLRWRPPLALSAALALALLVLALRPAPPPPAPVPAETFAMLASETDRELLAAMEFYLWLGEEADDEG